MYILITRPYTISFLYTAGLPLLMKLCYLLLKVVKGFIVFCFYIKKKYLVNQWDTQILLPTTQNKQVAYRTLFVDINTLKIKLLSDSL